MRTILLKSSAAALLALACLLLFFLSACGVEGSESSAGSNDPESSGESIQGVSVQLRDATLSPTRLNAEPEGDEIALFERNYKKDGASVLDYTLSSNDRTVIGFSPEKTDGGNRFEVFAVLENEGEACPIPYGGFLLSVPKALLTDKRVRKGQVASVEGALSIPKGEPLQYGSFYPDGEYSSALERRIHLADPRVPLNESSTEPERIYYYSSDYDGDFGTLPEECTLAVLEKVTNLSSRIVRIVSSDHVEPGETALVFRGAYNRAYAETFLKEGMKVFLNHLDRVSSLCDREAVYVNSVLYPISDGHYNCASTDEDGVYLFDSSFSSPGVPTSKAGQRDIVLINEKVAFIGETNVPVMIPINGGVAVSLTGSYAESAGKLKIGDRAETVLIDTTQVSGKSVRIGETMFTYDKVDEIRAPEGVTVLYTPQYGNSTGSNMYGLEIAVSGGVVTGVENGKGNMTIPKDGYVISIHKDAAQFAAATQVTAGQTAMTFEDGIGYRLREAKVNRVNSTRSENTLIVYRNAKSTNTNAYGYEIAVDSDNRMIAESYAGNMAIPADGFVLSAHGTMIGVLEDAYVYGSLAIFDEDSMTAVMVSTPESFLLDSAHKVETFESSIKSAKSQLKYLDYESLDRQVSDLKNALSSAQEGLREADYGKLLEGLSQIESGTGTLDYPLIETHPVENRAVWYRSKEKSDAEVEAVIQKMKDLNVNSIYLETWYNGRFIGYSDNELILHAAGNGDYDALEGFVRIGHENGIEVHAWVENFFIGTVEAQEQANMKLAEHFKGRWLIDRDGTETFYYAESQTHFIFLNPFDSEVQQFLLDFYAEIIRKYDVDGIHLDYIRFPEKNGNATFGYNDDIVAAWQSENKTDVHPSKITSGALLNSWNLFRQNIITGFVERVFNTVKKENPDVWLSAAVYPGIPSIKNDIFQDCAEWVKRSIVDELFSMSYGGDVSYVSQNAKQFSSLCGDACFYSTGLMAFGDSSENALGTQMTEVRKSGSDGVAIFSLANITPSRYYTPVKSGSFRNPSVQATKIHVTAAAQIRFILDKADDIYLKFGNATEESIRQAHAILEPILNLAESLQDSDMSLSESIAYCESTIGKLSDASASLKGILGNSCGSDCEKQIRELIHWLTVSKARLEARK